MKTPKKRIPGQSIRNTWQINPRTRVHDNDIRKNQKQFRQMSKKELQNLMKRNQKTSPQKDWFDLSRQAASKSIKPAHHDQQQATNYKYYRYQRTIRAEYS